MSWTRSSRGATFGVLLLVALAAVGSAAALTVEYTQPEPAQVGESIEYNATIEEPFRDAPDQWTLQGQTELGNATWTIQVLAQGDPVATRDFGGESFTYDLNSQSGATTVEITVSGDVTAIEEYNYEDRSSENHTVMTIARLSDGNTNPLQTIVGHRYSEQSRQARQAIDAAIEAVGGRNDKIEQAISAYDSENFENAIALAQEAESGAQSGQLLLYGIGALVLVALVGGGVYYWRERREKGYKLQ